MRNYAGAILKPLRIRAPEVWTYIAFRAGWGRLTISGPQFGTDPPDLTHWRFSLAAITLGVLLFSSQVVGAPTPDWGANLPIPDLFPQRPLSSPPTGAFTASPTPTCPSAWSIVDSPNPTTSNYLSGGAAISANDVWAVGHTGIHTLTMHWDGNQWSIVPSPDRGNNLNILSAVAAISANDVWAVGWSHSTGSGWLTLTEHWDGQQWSIVSSPNQPGGTIDNYLQGVSTVSTNDVWTVGYYVNNSGIEQTLTEHWDGSQWSIVPSPNVGTENNILYAVAAMAANDVWAVGDYAYDELTLVVHWNGSSWAVIPSPNPSGAPGSALYSVTAIAGNDLWAAGTYSQVSGGTNTLTEHWDGTQWTIVPSPNLVQGDNILLGMAGIASNDVWAAGYSVANSAVTLIEHWDGQQWSVVPSPNSGTSFNQLTAMTTVSSTDVWAVGWWDNCLGCSDFTLIEHYTLHCPPPSATPPPTLAPSATTTPGTSASATPPTPAATATRPPPTTQPTMTPITPSPTVTVTGTALVTATATPTPPATVTATAISTATTCPIQFTDVHPSDYFYQPVTYLACRGVISGYADGTFRPYTNTTRAQMVKIVVRGFQEPIVTPVGGNYTFADVAPPLPFFAVIETAAADSIVSGYACGGPGEPCDAQHRPYFRPYATVTRGQLAKITVGAAGWALQNPATGSFTDVSVGSAFYRFVETAVCRGILSGYVCGGAGEPCDAQHRPYFRPSNPATRGQIAKIVYLAITAGGSCSP